MDAVRTEVTSARRLVVKVGSSSLAGPDGGIDADAVRALTDALAARCRDGAEVVLVSSGAIAAGLGPLGLARRPRDLATQQAAAAVGQGLLVHRYTEELARHGIVTGQVLLTVDDVTRRSHYRNAHRTFARLLELGVLPVVNENDTVATGEIRFGDNDRLAALVSHLVHADLLLLLSDVDGLYDGPPSRAGARLLEVVAGESDLAGITLGAPGGMGSSGIGTGGMRTKVEAARIATAAGIPVVLTSAAQGAPALAGEPVGTLFQPTGRRRPTRLLWLEHATEARGGLVLDDGAVVQRRKSLLPAGVVAVSGTFVAGDPVDLLDVRGALVARGLVNYDSSEIPELLGRSTKDLARELGSGYEREIIHRDDLVVLGD